MTDEEISYLAEILFKISEADAMRVFRKLSQRILDDNKNEYWSDYPERESLN